MGRFRPVWIFYDLPTAAMEKRWPRADLLKRSINASRGRHGLQAAAEFTPVPAGTALRAAAEPQVPVKVN